jgi:hypothetical protein
MIVDNTQVKIWLAQINQARQLLEMDFKTKIHQRPIRKETPKQFINNKSSYFMIKINQISKTLKMIILILASINKA